MPDDESQHIVQPRAKRRKIALACDPCRVRKAKCDGTQPICGPCQARIHDKRACKWADKPVNRKIDSISEPINDVQDSEALTLLSARPVSLSRLAAVKTSQTRPVTSMKSLFPTSTHGDHNEEQNIQCDLSKAYKGSNNSFKTPPAHSDASLGDIRQRRDVVNAMGAAPFSPEPLNVHSSAFYGGSSAAHFMNQVREGISSRSTSQLHASRAPLASALNLQHASVPTETLEDIILPSRHFADQLMDVFWKESHTLYPFLHRNSMEVAFQTLWDSKKAWQNPGSIDLGIGSTEASSSHTRIYQCALNAIFALSCQLAPPEMIQQDRHVLSERFFARCQDYLHIDILDQGSLALVQTLLIITQYLQSTHSPSRCWNSLGLACRIGQGLGLHVEDSTAKLDPTQVELRRRVWHGCNVMDIVTSMTLGRPTMTQQHNLPHPVSVWDEDFITYGTRQRVSILSSYMQTINLYQILANVITDIYKPWSPYSVHESPLKDAMEQDNEMQTVLALADKLTKYSQGIDRLLHWRTGNDLREQLPSVAQRAVQRQSNVLHARFLHVQILLHRPSFLRVCRRLVSSWEPNGSGRFTPKEQTPSSFKSAIEVQSAVKCVTVAVELVSTLQLSIDKRNAGAWWYSMFYLYSAGMVLVLSKSCLPLQKEFDIACADQAWTDCCDILRSLRPYGQAPELGLESLLAMHDRLVLSSKPATQVRTAQDAPPNQQQEQEPSQSQQYRDFATINDNTTGDLDIPFDQQVDMFDVDLWSSRQPLMDFMTHDLDSMLPGMLDDYWWGINQIGI